MGVLRDLTERWLREAIRGTDGTSGWVKVVDPYLSASDVSRSTANMLTLRLGWFPTFDVAEPEPVLIAAPWWSTAHNVSADPSYLNMTVAVSVPTVSISGDLVGSEVTEASLRSRSHSIQMVLEGCDWTLDAGRPGSSAYVALSRAVASSSVAEMSPGRSSWMLAASGLLQVHARAGVGKAACLPRACQYMASASDAREDFVCADAPPCFSCKPRVNLNVIDTCSRTHQRLPRCRQSETMRRT